ncbi:MAG: class I SAM-dependent methyltransferase, partial [Anderseniella sp.]
ANSVSFAGSDLDYYARYKIDDLKAIADQNQDGPSTILDFGSGVGNSLVPMRNAFPSASIRCLDVSQASLDICKRQNVENTTYHCYDGKMLPFDDGEIDLAFTACVFHHIPEDDHILCLREICRCLSEQGRFVLFEHNPYNPLTQLAVARCPFDEDAVLIAAKEMKRRFKAAGFTKIDIRYRVFFPEFARFLRPLERFFAWLPLGGQYYIDAQR